MDKLLKDSIKCFNCHTSEGVKIVGCHNYCLQCLNKLYSEISKCKICDVNIDWQYDILPFFNKHDLYDFKSYRKRIYGIQNDVFDNDKRDITEYFNREKYESYLILEKIGININEFLNLYNKKILVYEIFNLKDNEIKVSEILIYYPEVEICFIYERCFRNRISWIIKSFLVFKKIIRNIKKDELDSIYLSREKSEKHKELLKIKYNSYRISNIMNPDGFTQFPKEFENLYRIYVNRTHKPIEFNALKHFKNYLWIHYWLMFDIEKSIIKDIAYNILILKNEVHEEIVNYIISYL